MALEATVICIDNSEWMRNGDFAPTRFEAQQDACISICGVKTRQNPENSVGLISTAGKSIEVCVPLTQDLGKVIAALHKVKISGDSNFVGAIRVAQLALRHRQKTGRKQEQRIVLFVGSPVTADKQELEDIGRQLKKNSVAIDIVSFGEPNAQENEEMLQTLLNATNNKDESGKDNSHIVPIPSGNLSDVLGQMNGDMPGAAPSMDLDPELAWAMELSKQTFAAETKQSTSSKPAEPSGGEKDIEMKDTEEALPSLGDDESDLQAALRLSLESDLELGGSGLEMEMDPDFVLAVQMSQATAIEDKKRDEIKKEEKAEKKEEKKENKEEKKEEKLEVKKDNKKEEKQEGKKEDTTNMEVDPTAIDPSFLASVVLELPNVDINDPEVQSLLHSLNKDKDKDKEKK